MDDFNSLIKKWTYRWYRKTQLAILTFIHKFK